MCRRCAHCRIVAGYSRTFQVTITWKAASLALTSCPRPYGARGGRTVSLKRPT
jgi:hypothetical protein